MPVIIISFDPATRAGQNRRMDNAVWIVAIVCFTAYQIFALRRTPRPYEELKALNGCGRKG